MLFTSWASRPVLCGSGAGQERDDRAGVTRRPAVRRAAGAGFCLRCPTSFSNPRGNEHGERRRRLPFTARVARAVTSQFSRGPGRFTRPSACSFAIARRKVGLDTPSSAASGRSPGSAPRQRPAFRPSRRCPAVWSTTVRRREGAHIEAILVERNTSERPAGSIIMTIFAGKPVPGKEPDSREAIRTTQGIRFDHIGPGEKSTGGNYPPSDFLNNILQS